MVLLFANYEINIDTNSIYSAIPDKIFSAMPICNPMKSGNTVRWMKADRNCLKMP